MTARTIREIAGRTIPLIISLSLVTGLFIVPRLSFAKNDSAVTINEIHITGGPGKTTEDFIELLNSSDEAVLIGNWQLKKRTGTGSESSINKFNSLAIIPAKGGYLWVNSSLSIDADTATGATISNNNSIGLFDSEGKLIDAVGWGNCGDKSFRETICFPLNPTESQSLIRINDSDDNSMDFILDTPTPESGQCNKYPSEARCIIPAPPEPPPPILSIYSNKLYLNEILPQPAGDEKTDEYVELFNSSDDDIDLAGWTIKDATKSRKYSFPQGTIIKSKDFLVVYRKDFGFALNNSGPETVSLLDPNGSVASEISYESAREAVSYNYFDESLWRWSNKLTPGKENEFNKLPRIEYSLAKTAYPKIYADFSVRINGSDKNKTKVTWNFGDGHKSYILKTRHKYEKLGMYTGSVTVFDGSEEVKKEFSVTVKKFSHPKVRIISLSSNPAGKDSENEWVEIKNDTKKKVNLKGWSVATGWKKLVNHPIKEDFEIPAKKSRILTRQEASFTLANTKTKIELRYPDGKTAHKISYEKEKIKEDEVYARIDGVGWQWKITPSSIIDNQPAIIQPPLEIDASKEITIPEEDIGKYSVNQDRNTFLAEYAIDSLPTQTSEIIREIIGNEEIVLGATTVRLRLYQSTFFFTSETNLPQHYAARFGKKIITRANLLISSIWKEV